MGEEVHVFPGGEGQHCPNPPHYRTVQERLLPPRDEGGLLHGSHDLPHVELDDLVQLVGGAVQLAHLELDLATWQQGKAVGF